MSSPNLHLVRKYISLHLPSEGIFYFFLPSVYKYQKQALVQQFWTILYELLHFVRSLYPKQIRMSLGDEDEDELTELDKK